MDTEYVVDLLAAVAQYPPVSKQGGNNISQRSSWMIPLWEICPTLPPRIDLQCNRLTGFNCATHGVLQHSFLG